mmetsp:Transcript_77237/g.222183  ORF Transcript_77237/g.222183 Transcript_77237/m.222183 type:complete len:357 (+) Transcript_77237:119-1189(+)
MPKSNPKKPAARKANGTADRDRSGSSSAAPLSAKEATAAAALGAGGLPPYDDRDLRAMCFAICVLALMIGLILRLVTDASSSLDALSLNSNAADLVSAAGAAFMGGAAAGAGGSAAPRPGGPNKFQTPREKLAAERYARQLEQSERVADIAEEVAGAADGEFHADVDSDVETWPPPPEEEKAAGAAEDGEKAAAATVHHDMKKLGRAPEGLETISDNEALAAAAEKDWEAEKEEPLEPAGLLYYCREATRIFLEAVMVIILVLMTDLGMADKVGQRRQAIRREGTGRTEPRSCHPLHTSPPLGSLPTTKRYPILTHLLHSHPPHSPRTPRRPPNCWSVRPSSSCRCTCSLSPAAAG